MDNKVLSRLYDRKESLEAEIETKERYLKELLRMLRTTEIQIKNEEDKSI